MITALRPFWPASPRRLVWDRVDPWKGIPNDSHVTNSFDSRRHCSSSDDSNADNHAAQSPVQKPDIIMIMGDDIGWAKIGVYNQGIMTGRTAIAIRPQLERPLKGWAGADHVRGVTEKNFWNRPRRQPPRFEKQVKARTSP